MPCVSKRGFLAAIPWLDSALNTFLRTARPDLSVVNLSISLLTLVDALMCLISKGSSGRHPMG